MNVPPESVIVTMRALLGDLAYQVAILQAGVAALEAENAALKEAAKPKGKKNA